jgi:hypothetical protein
MNKIDTSQVVSLTSKQPFTSKSLAFLQDATKEGLLGLVTGMIGNAYNSATAYILYGVDAYGTNQYNDGYILYGGELYYCAGKTTTTAFSNVAVMTITVANDATADPVTFTDNVIKNVHNVRTIVLSDALTGTGTFDLSAAVYLNTSWVAPTLLNSWADIGGTYQVAQYRIMNGCIELRGVITGGANNTVAFTLPVGFRPLYDHAILVWGGDSPITPVIITLLQNGDVYMRGGGLCSLSNVRIALD